MKAYDKKDDIIEFGNQPEEGMVLVGFSSKAILEGIELKKEIIELLKNKVVGYRMAVNVFMKKALASFDEAKSVIDNIENDLRRTKNEQLIFQKKYDYNINKVFWTYKENIPKDPRYFQLQVLNVDKDNTNKYVNEDKSFNAEKFIRENMSKEDVDKLLKKNPFVFKEDVPESETPQNDDF
jgi:hypothetical protein